MKRLKIFSLLVAAIIFVASVSFTSDGNAYVGSPASHARHVGHRPHSGCHSGCHKKMRRHAPRAPRVRPGKRCHRGCGPRRPAPRQRCPRCR